MRSADGLNTRTGDQPGDPGTNGFDRFVDGSIVLFFGFAVPLVPLFHGHWLEYFLPPGLLFSFIHLLRHNLTTRDYFTAIPRGFLVAIGALVVLGVVAALRVSDLLSPYQQLRSAAAPFAIYFAFYGVMFFVLIRGSVLSARILKGLLWGTLTAVAILALEPFTGIASEWIFPLARKTGPFQLASFNRTFLMLAMFSWLAAPWLSRRFGSAAIGIVPPLAVWLLNFTGESETVLVGVIASVAVYLAAIWRPRWILNIVFSGSVILLLSAPVFYPLLFQISTSLLSEDKLGFLVRTEIWDAVARFVADAPVFGYGMLSTLRFGPLDFANLYYSDRIIYHPHNGFLQLWADMGVPGVLAATVLFWAMWTELKKVADDRLPHLLALFTMTILPFLNSFSIWATWWVGLLGMAAAYGIATSGTIGTRTTGRSDGK